MRKIIDLNKFYEEFQEDPMLAKLKLVQKAARVLIKAVNAYYYSEEELANPNYSEICEWLEWLDFQDNGIFEDAIYIVLQTWY